MEIHRFRTRLAANHRPHRKGRKFLIFSRK
jgi:hypothetical protein